MGKNGKKKYKNWEAQVNGSWKNDGYTDERVAFDWDVDQKGIRAYRINKGFLSEREKEIRLRDRRRVLGILGIGGLGLLVGGGWLANRKGDGLEKKLEDISITKVISETELMAKEWNEHVITPSGDYYIKPTHLEEALKKKAIARANTKMTTNPNRATAEKENTDKGLSLLTNLRYRDFREENLLKLMPIHFFLAERITALYKAFYKDNLGEAPRSRDLSELRKYAWKKSTGRTFSKANFESMMKIYESYYTNGKMNLDCRTRSMCLAATYTALLLANNASDSFSIVSGLYFDEKIAPRGGGHMWIEMDGKIIEPSNDIAYKPFHFEPDKSKHVPILDYRLNVTPGNIGITQKIRCFPRELK